jgi:hypothetical protein
VTTDSENLFRDSGTQHATKTIRQQNDRDRVMNCPISKGTSSNERVSLFSHASGNLCGFGMRGPLWNFSWK